ncbi:MAG: hypothetical protein GQ582_07530 [Methyloprofundus sp.]|nr:hypothetical protein [Methyloprofundus sp.]
MTVDAIYYLVTGAGILFVIMSMSLIFLGKSVGGNDEGAQRLKLGNRLEVSLNSALALVVISGMIALAPLTLKTMTVDLSAYIARSDVGNKYILKSDVDKNYESKSIVASNFISMQELKEKYILKDDGELLIYGSVIDEDTNSSIADAQIIVMREGGKLEDPVETDNNGLYKIELKHVKLGEKLRITVIKDGYPEFSKPQKHIKGEIPLALSLSKTGDN